MGRWIAWCVVLWIAAGPGQARGQESAARVLDVLAQRCAACHGTTVEKPKGKFGFVDDLHRLAGDRDYVVPGDAEGSGLWQVIEYGDMPPEDTEHGLLTEVEKETIRRWIAEGAKVPEDLQPTPAPGSEAKTGTNAQAAFSVGRLVAFVGRFHPMVVHFPIALVLAALAAELLRKRQAARVCLTLGALGAIAAAGLGWALWWNTAAMGERETYMTLHQWVGSAMAVWVAMTWGFERAVRVPRKFYLAALVIACVGIGLVGHWGGLLAWGLDYYRW